MGGAAVAKLKRGAAEAGAATLCAQVRCHSASAAVCAPVASAAGKEVEEAPPIPGLLSGRSAGSEADARSPPHRGTSGRHSSLAYLVGVGVGVGVRVR
eukprot:scaffold55318_cov90-Phaeocystis_antarctica.AAC.1